MRFKIALSIIVVSVFLISPQIYAVEVNYDLDSKKIEKTPVSVSKKLAVIVFDDMRPDIERSAKARLENIIEDANFYTEDHAYLKNDDKKQKYDVSQQVSRMIAQHLNQRGLFLKTDFIDARSTEFLDKNKKELFEEYDLVLTGKIKHYYGFCKMIGDIKDDGAAVALLLGGGLLGGALGVVTEQGEYEALPKKIEGYTALTEIKLVDLKSGRILWSGEAVNRFKDTKSKYASSMYKEAHSSLRNAVDELIEKLKESKIE